MDWDVFISHASEDKEAIARPLAKQLQGRGIKVWFDEFTLTVGDSLRQSIDAGLARSRFGIVIISPAFLQKAWPQRELDGLVAREIAGVKVILPVWHKVDIDDVRTFSPTLADRLSASSGEGLEKLTDRLLEAINKGAPALANLAKPKPHLAHSVPLALAGRAKVYCIRCGATPGTSSKCPNYSSHDFAKLDAAGVYCIRCGATPGVASKCPHYSSHDFAKLDAAGVYCIRCGATPGVASECPHYSSHDFAKLNSAADVYCIRCGATPGVASECPNYSSHDFVKA